MPNFLEKITKNKPVFYGTLGVIGIGAIVYYRHKQASAAASATSPDAAAATGTDSGDPCDPSSSAYDPAACAQMQGSYVGDPYGGGSFGSYGYPPSTPGAATGNDVTTKEAWVQSAQQILPNGGSATVRNALLGVLGGLTVTQQEKEIFLEAVGVLGDPPGGYPKPIKVSNTKGHPGPSEVTVPDVKGDTFDSAQNKLQAAGLQVRKNQPNIHIVTTESPAAGAKVKKGTVVHVGGHK